MRLEQMTASTTRSACAALALVLAAAAPWPAASEPTPADTQRTETRRPKIGLVLSGGGARGAAHIGVLKVLEELCVPVDVIAGTSMGSIVGASYATGLSVAQMEAVIGTITTDKLFTDKPPRADQTMRQKTDDETPYIIPELGIGKGGVVLPKGIVTGVALEGELRRLVQIGTASNFDELPIPFRAIATDIGTGEMVVLSSGSVVQAIRASMSVPGAVAPVTIGRRQLVDGGLVRNLPVDVARAMGAEIIIAVNLGTPLLKPDDITSVFSVTTQMINILTEQNVSRSLHELRPGDVLIVPELGDFSSTDFDHLKDTVPVGEAAARKVADRLRALALPPEQYAALRERQRAPAAKEAVIIAAIRVEGTKRVSPEVVLQSLQTQVGQQLDRDTIDLDMRRVFGRGDFENVNYTIDDVDGKQTLTVLVREKPERDYFRFGLELDADLGKQSNFNLFASYRSKWLNAWGAEWRSDLVLGTNVLVGTEFYQPLSARQYFFVVPRVQYSVTPWYLFEDTIQIAQYKNTEAIAAFDVGANIIEYGEVRVGARYGYRSFDLQSGSPRFPSNAHASLGALNAQLTLDRLDNLNFTHSGYRVLGQLYSSLKALGADDEYSYWRGLVSGAQTWGAHTLEGLVTAANRIGGNDIPAYDLFNLGGFLYLSGLQRQQQKTQDFVFGRLVYRTKLASIPLFEGIYVGASAEAARLKPAVPVWQGQPVDGYLNIAAGSIYFGLDSPLGPLYVGFGYANKDNKAIYLFLGRP
ncbi:MAG TPA: patatin-like phospholipase family protein [Burkholderiaceae bacterium]|nr:patatin-like phospholipase family protein [Burkholderiaceae bacterium]